MFVTKIQSYKDNFFKACPNIFENKKTKNVSRASRVNSMSSYLNVKQLPIAIELQLSKYFMVWGLSLYKGNITNIF